jgi:hypothetical protein
MSLLQWILVITSPSMKCQHRTILSTLLTSKCEKGILYEICCPHTSDCEDQLSYWICHCIH